MAHFYADIQGNRGPASRMGSKSSGISGHIRGWNIGVSVSGWFDAETGQDCFEIRQTGGSNGFGQSKLLARISAKDIET